MNSLKINVGGISCDNKKCSFSDMGVKFEDYNEWLNKPCPDCGCNLLTEKDFNTVKLLVGLTEIINEGVPGVAEDEKLFKMSVSMDGSGKAIFSEIEPV